MRKWILVLSPIFFILAIIAGLRIFLQPKVEAWVLAQVQDYSKNQLPVLIEAESFDLIWFTPKVKLINTKIIPKPGQQLGFTEASVASIEARLDLIQVLGGRIQLSLLILEKPKAEVDLDQLPKSDKPLAEIDWQPIFNQLKTIPLKRIALVDGEFYVHSRKENFDINAQSLQSRILLDRDRIEIDLQTSNLETVFKKFKNRSGIRIDTALTPNSIVLQQLNLNTEGQSLLLKGILTDPRKLLTNPQGNLTAKISSNLDSLSQQIQPLIKIPELKGRIDLSAQVKIQGRKVPSGELEITGQDIHVGKAEVGSFQSKGTSDGESINIPKFTIKHSGGQIDLNETNLKASTQEDGAFALKIQSQVKAQDINLHQLLKAIDVGEIPVELGLQAQTNCGGPLLPQLNIVCVGEAQGSDLIVKADMKDKEPIAAVKNFTLNGGFEVSLDAVTFNTKVKAGEDNGSSSGLIKYTQGFLINFETPKFDLNTVKKIGGLKLEGKTKISGSTRGDSDAATFELKAQGDDFVFEDFILGSAETTIKYEKGTLYLPDLKGSLGVSSYEANIEAHLAKPNLVVKAKSAKMDWTDLFKIFDRKFKLPVPVTGSGNFDITVDGPYELGKLSYVLDAKIDRLAVSGESFSDGHIRLNSQSGEVRSEVFQIKKGSQLITAQGQGHPNGQIEAVVSAEQLLLEESELVGSMDSNMSGRLQALVDIKGFILEPQFRFQLQLNQFIIDNQEFPPSTADFSLNANGIDGGFSLFAGHLLSEFKYPFKENRPLSLKAKAIDWNFTTMAALMGGGALLNEYEASITGDMELHSEKGKLWDANGKLLLTKFLLKRGSLALANPKPMGITMSNGVMALQNFRVTGDDSFYELSGSRITKDNLRFQLNGEGSLRLFHVFVPFLEELAGQGVFNIAFSGGQNQLEILGQANLKDGFAKIKGFPHALERLSTQVQFSQTKILINDIRGGFAGGTVKGDGSVMLNGSQNFPTNIRARIEGASLNVPDKVRTSGNLDLRFSGSWFPFLLSGNYTVTGGVFEKELEESGGTEKVKQSSYLPKQIRDSSFEPVLLDLQIDLARPLTMKNSMIDGQATGQIQVRGIPTSPILLGNVNLTNGSKLLFRDKIFDVNNANVKFTDESEINPELYVSARSRIGNYDINLLVQGTAKNPLVKLTSLPPLPDQEIISLLALGVTNTAQPKSGNAAVDENVTRSEAQATAANALVGLSGLKKNSPIDVNISSAFDDTKNASVHKLTFKVKLSEKAEASATTNVDNSGRDAKVKYYLSPNWSAVGSWESKRDDKAVDQQSNESGVFGIDFDFSREFK